MALPALTEKELRLQFLSTTNVITKIGDGFMGWEEKGPFDKIIVPVLEGSENNSSSIARSGKLLRILRIVRLLKLTRLLKMAKLFSLKKT